jgi:hypothetical protein
LSSIGYAAAGLAFVATWIAAAIDVAIARARSAHRARCRIVSCGMMRSRAHR